MSGDDDTCTDTAGRASEEVRYDDAPRARWETAVAPAPPAEGHTRFPWEPVQFIGMVQEQSPIAGAPVKQIPVFFWRRFIPET